MFPLNWGENLEILWKIYFKTPEKYYWEEYAKIGKILKVRKNSQEIRKNTGKTSKKVLTSVWLKNPEKYSTPGGKITFSNYAWGLALKPGGCLHCTALETWTRPLLQVALVDNRCIFITGVVFIPHLNLALGTFHRVLATLKYKISQIDSVGEFNLLKLNQKYLSTNISLAVLSFWKITQHNAW